MRYHIAAHGFSGMLDFALQLYTKNAKALMGLTALCMLPELGLLVLDAQGAFDASTLEFLLNPEDPESAITFSPVLTLLSTAIAVLTFPIGGGAAMLLMTADIFGDRLTWKEALQQTWRRKWPLWWTSAVVTALFWGGMLLIVPGVYFMLRFGLVHTVILLEQTSGMAAFARSTRLMRSYYWAFLGLLLVAYVGIMFLSIFVGIALGSSEPLLNLAVWGLQVVLLAGVTVITLAVYFSARCKHEQFDLTLAAALSETASPSSTNRGDA